MKKLSTRGFTFAIILSIASTILTYGVSNANDLLGTSSVSRQTPGIDASPAMFRALNLMTTEEHAGIMPMTDGQLASIEGGRRWTGRININTQIAVVVPINIAVLSRDVSQTITVDVGQLIRNR